MKLNYVNPKGKKNVISTTKYKWWNFIFLFLFQQYQRACNIFYLLNALCTFFPGGAIVSSTTIFLPIAFVLIVAAVREILEDFGRKRSDVYANQLEYEVIRNGSK